MTSLAVIQQKLSELVTRWGNALAHPNADAIMTLEHKEGGVSELRFANGVVLEARIVSDGDKLMFKVGALGSEVDAFTINANGAIDLGGSIEANEIREKTADIGVTVEQVLIKDGKIHLPGSGVIGTYGTLYMDIDTNDNETNRGFMIRNNGVTRIFYVEDDGRVNIDCADGGAMLRLYDVGAANANDASPYIDFRYTDAQGNPTLRLGRLGCLSTSNPDFYVESQDGDLKLIGNKILANGKEVATVAETGDWIPSLGGNSVLDVRYAKYEEFESHYNLTWDFTVTSIGTGNAQRIYGQPENCGTEFGHVDISYLSETRSSFYSITGFHEKLTNYIQFRLQTSHSQSVGAGSVFENNTRCFGKSSFKKAI